MEAPESESAQGIGSVKAAISLYGESIRVRKPDKPRTQIFAQEDLPSKTRELHRAKASVGRLHEAKQSAEKEKARAELELSRARGVAKELASRIEESNARARARRSEIRSVSKTERGPEDAKYARVLQELEQVKRELSRLKLDAAAASVAKAKAEKEIEESTSKTIAYSQTVEELKRKIDEADEEHVLVELARIEAEREVKEIEQRRRNEADKFATNIETAQKRIKELRRELNRSKEREIKLRVTNSDVNVLQGEMELVRAMERNDQADLVNKANKMKEEGSDPSVALKSAEAELEAAKRELAAVKEESFQFMVSMDALRQELIQIAEETNRLNTLEKKAESNIQHLHSKLLKAKSILEAATTADERSKALVSSLSTALRQMQTEVEAAKREKELIHGETANIRAEIDKTDLDISLVGERLQVAMQELEAARASESVALKKLRNVTTRVMKSRAASAPYSSTMTISKSEYEYLSQQAAAAQAVAVKKMEAAQAWIEALVAEEKEILLKTELTQTEINELRNEQVMKHGETEKSSMAPNALARDPDEPGDSEEEEDSDDMQTASAKQRKLSIRENSMIASSRRTKVRRVSTSSAARSARSPSFTMKRKSILPNLFKLLGNRNSRKPK